MADYLAALGKVSGLANGTRLPIRFRPGAPMS